MILKPGIKIIALELVLLLVLISFNLMASLFVLAFLIFSVIFFRNPKRKIERGIISPADGKIDYLEGNRLEIFMGPFDAHVNFSPVDGIVKEIKTEGKRVVPAFLRVKDAKRKKIVIENKAGKFIVTLVAGIFARRILCFVKKGDRIDKGQRIGMIVFGSRVVLEIPKGFKFVRKVGEKIKAGETVAINLKDFLEIN